LPVETVPVRQGSSEAVHVESGTRPAKEGGGLKNCFKKCLWQKGSLESSVRSLLEEGQAVVPTGKYREAPYVKQWHGGTRKVAHLS